MSTSKALQKIKASLDGKFNVYICWVAKDLKNNRQISIRSYELIVATVGRRLGNWATLEGWLSARHGIKHIRWWEPDGILYREKMCTTRKAWIDSLTAEFAAKGD